MRHGRAWPRPVELHGVLWRTMADPVAGNSEQERRTLPVVDPVMDVTPDQEAYIRNAQSQRETLAHRYLDDWNDETLQVFDVYGKMSQYSNLWRILTCGQLERLLKEEYPNSNLPFQIRTERSDIADYHEHLEQDWTFVGVVYRDRMTDQIPRVFRNPVASDTQAYSQVMIFVPQRRLVLWRPGTTQTGGTIGGVPGERLPLPGPGGGTTSPPNTGFLAETVRQSGRYFPEHWDLLNQPWAMQLVPAVSPSIGEILSTHPYVNAIPAYELPNLRTMNESDLQWLSHH